MWFLDLSCQHFLDMSFYTYFRQHILDWEDICIIFLLLFCIFIHGSSTTRIGCFCPWLVRTRNQYKNFLAFSLLPITTSINWCSFLRKNIEVVFHCFLLGFKKKKTFPKLVHVGCLDVLPSKYSQDLMLLSFFKNGQGKLGTVMISWLMVALNN